jgi:hypothetical protein
VKCCPKKHDKISLKSVYPDNVGEMKIKQNMISLEMPVPSQGHCGFPFSGCRLILSVAKKGNNKITELRAILQRERQNS